MRIMCLAILILTSSLISCQQRALRSGYVIEQYRSAECVTPFNDESISPGNVTRAWNTTLKVTDKLGIHITAGEHVGGNVVVRYLPDRQDLTVVPPRDSFYPTDIRIDRDRGFLYVKTDGLAAGIWRETWLYACDLPQRKLLSHVLVDPAVLPSECPISQNGLLGN
jgi:hypothetical protein